MVMHSHRVEKFGLYSKYKRYRLGSHIKFKIDTHNRKGHLYILNIRDKHIDRIYPRVNLYFQADVILKLL